MKIDEGYSKLIKTICEEVKDEKMTKNKVKCCPCCSEIDSVVIKSKFINNNLMYRVICDYSQKGCGIRTGWEASIDVAIDVWNYRKNSNT